MGIWVPVLALRAGGGIVICDFEMMIESKGREGEIGCENHSEEDLFRLNIRQAGYQACLLANSACI